jgi:hypothetical protein
MLPITVMATLFGSGCTIWACSYAEHTFKIIHTSSNSDIYVILVCDLVICHSTQISPVLRQKTDEDEIA